jgi:hypothetical protein
LLQRCAERLLGNSSRHVVCPTRTNIWARIWPPRSARVFRLTTRSALAPQSKGVFLLPERNKLGVPEVLIRRPLHKFNRFVDKFSDGGDVLLQEFVKLWGPRLLDIPPSSVNVECSSGAKSPPANLLDPNLLSRRPDSGSGCCNAYS